jgi:hypothetical protein
MRLHSGLAHEEASGNLLVGQALGHYAKDFQLTFGQLHPLN